MIAKNIAIIAMHGMVKIMPKSSSVHEFEVLLELLADWLNAKHPGKLWDLSIVGGAALAYAGHKDTTVDVDVILPFPLPPEIKQGVAAVARVKRVGDEWLNEGVGAIFSQIVPKHQLPSYFFQVERVVEIGGNLRITLPVRQTLISSKLLAASPSYQKHIDDLRRLKPKVSELQEAVRFVLSCDASAIRRQDLRLIFSRLGVDADACMGEST